jgi:myo-inositol-1(or 4)-monophosphatase
MSDVKYGAIIEIKGNTTFFAERGGGAEVLDGAGNSVPITLSPTVDIPSMAWAAEVVGAPLEQLFRVMAGFANPTTVRGGFFILNSSAFELTRLLTGQLAAVIDVRNRLLRDQPDTKEQFREHGGGRLLSLYAYDIAAAALLVQEAGGVITDAWGRDLADWKLLDTTESNFGSMIAAANTELHAKLLQSVDRGFERYGGTS